MLPHAPVWVGVDLGASKIMIVAVDEERDVCASVRIATQPDLGPAGIIDGVAAGIRSLDVDIRRIAGIGLGFAGLVDASSGRVASSIMLPGWDRFPAADLLSGALSVPVFVENDATAAGYGEFIALGRPARSTIILLTVGTGIGGAIIIGGRVFRGALGLAGEFGNMIIDPSGPVCRCGHRGCLNVYGSGEAIARRANELLGDPTAFRSALGVVDAASRGSAAAARALDEGARAVGLAIGNIINVFNPDRVVLAGGVPQIGEAYFESVRRAAQNASFSEAFAAAAIVPSVRGYDVGAFGAAHVARSRALETEARL